MDVSVYNKVSIILSTIGLSKFKGIGPITFIRGLQPVAMSADNE